MVPETSDKKILPAGVYVHRETGEKIEAVATEKFGNPQADAFVRLGYVHEDELKDQKAEEKQTAEEKQIADNAIAKHNAKLEEKNNASNKK